MRIYVICTQNSGCLKKGTKHYIEIDGDNIGTFHRSDGAIFRDISNLEELNEACDTEYPIFSLCSRSQKELMKEANYNA